MCVASCRGKSAAQKAPRINLATASLPHTAAFSLCVPCVGASQQHRKHPGSIWPLPVSAQASSSISRTGSWTLTICHTLAIAFLLFVSHVGASQQHRKHPGSIWPPPVSAQLPSSTSRTGSWTCARHALQRWASRDIGMLPE